MARSTQKSSGMNKNLMIVAFSVVAGTLVTACQPQLMKNLDQSAPVETSPVPVSSPMPSGVPVTGTESMQPKKNASPAEVNAQIDTSLKTFDSTMNDGDPNEVNGSDLK